MSLPVTEFVYFKLKPSVKPEDPTNEEGQQFIKTLQATKNQLGYESSAWGRTLEDDSVIVWAIDWNTAHDGGSRSSLLIPLLVPNTHITHIVTTLSPSPSTTDTFTKNPVTELCCLNFDAAMSPDEHAAVDAALIDFRSALVEKLPGLLKPKSWSTGQVERPGSREHRHSPSGKARMTFLAVGWESKEVHLEAKKEEVFIQAITPVRERMLPSIHETDMRHVVFQKV